MNNKLKSVLSFIKESLELKNKNNCSINDYEMSLDFSNFYNKYKEIIGEFDYKMLTINEENSILKIKYIKDEYKKRIPNVPDSLKKFIALKNGNDIIELVDNVEEKLKNENLYKEYVEYDKKIKEINKYNDLIDSYNSIYLHFYNVYRRITDYEEKIEVVFGQKLLIWNDDRGNKIERYILEANLEIDVNPITNTISFIIDNNKKKGFVTDFLNFDFYKVKDMSLLSTYVKKFNEELIHEEYDINSEIEKYINYISLENEIYDREVSDNEKLFSNKTYLFSNLGIVVRQKNIKLWIDDLENIINACDDTQFNSPILNMFEIDFNDDEQVLNLLNDKSYNETKNDDVLFPLESNDEQYKIVDKVKNSNVVLVQGPPGTGKSHTIANLLSHYISEGKRVIVTSEKAKALEVLREKIPQKIRSLSLALLTSKGVDKDLEFSIDTVLKHQMDEQELIKIKQEVENNIQKLKWIQNEKRNVMRKIVEFMVSDTISHKEKIKDIIGLGTINNLTLMDIAIWLKNNKQYKMISTNDIENVEYENIIDFFARLDEFCEEIKNNNFSISTSVPIIEHLNNNEIELHIKEYLNYKNYDVKNPQLINAIKQASLTDKIIDSLKCNLESLATLYELFDKEWIKSNISYETFVKKVKELRTYVNSNAKFISYVESNLYEKSINFDFDKKEYFLQLVDELLELYNDDGKVNIFNKIRFNGYIKKLDGLLYNDKIVGKDISKDTLILIKKFLQYYILVEEIKKKCITLLKIDLFDKFGIEKNQFGKYVNKLLDLLNLFIEYKEIAAEIDGNFGKIINKNLYKILYLETSEENVNSIFSDLQYYALENNITNNCSILVNEIREYYRDYNLQNLDELLFSIERNQLEDYQKEKILLLREIAIINQYNDLKKKYEKIFNDKKELIHDYIYKFNSSEKEFFKNNMDKIFKYHYIEKYYLMLENKQAELPKLQGLRKQLLIDEKRIISELIASKGWYYQNKNMNYNISVSLNKWMNLRKKLGAGTGKKSNLYLNQMRKEMDIAKDAIPVWIMPIDKLIEQYPFRNEPSFDVLIMDESSQSSIYSVSALARAKKVIIVGDDKQISPTNAFTNIDSINDLRAKYLKNNPWDLQISKDTSVYDIIQTFCGNKKITLTEHFRCLPEIINYSNKNFYNMEINPLKVRSKENTIESPIKTIFVPNSHCKKIGDKIYNEDEIQRIILLLGEIDNDSQYADKTIGIIALQNSNKYIEKLQESIMQKFGEKFINSRKIKVGTTYDFQGDERDVIILGMVISSVLENGERYNFRALTTKEYDRSFNVAASRAKEQMILVHSVKLDELSTNCNRYKLLNYCLNYDKDKRKEHSSLFESNFEKDVYDSLYAKDYKLIPQFVVGNYRIDFILENDKNQKIAIECDGDKYHGIDELEHDLERQTILERCGWKFIRIRASEFYYDKEKIVNKVVDEIENYLNGNDYLNYQLLPNINYEFDSSKTLSEDISINGIKNIVENNNNDINELDEIEDKKNHGNVEQSDEKTTESNDSLVKVVKSSGRPIYQMNDLNEIIRKFDTITAAVNATGINSKSIRDAANGIQKHAGGYVWKFVDKEPLLNNKVILSNVALNHKQFKYMILYSEGLSINDISEYYRDTYTNVKKYLDDVAKKYNKESVDLCVDSFKKQYSNTKKYINVFEYFKSSNMKLLNKKLERKLNDDATIKKLSDAIENDYEIEILYSIYQKRYHLKPNSYYENNGKYYLKATDIKENQIKLFLFEKILDVKILK